MKKILLIVALLITTISFAQDSTFGQSHQDSTKVKNNSITLAGVSIGLSTASSMMLLSGIAGQDVSYDEFMVMLLGPGFINGVVIPTFLKSENKGYLRAGMLVSSCATTVLPMLGAMFGAPNSNPTTVTLIIIMGTIGGAIYNHGLALIFPKYREALKTAKFKNQKNKTTIHDN
jgi:hypothetical protein